MRGRDEPWNLVALCPNCHVEKTRARDRERLRRTLTAVASRAHESALRAATNESAGLT